jgi:hypothetical protein
MRGSDSAFPQFKAELSRGHMESPRQLRCEPAACAAFGGGGGDYPVRRRTAGVHNAIAAQSSGAELVGTSELSRHPCLCGAMNDWVHPLRSSDRPAPYHLISLKWQQRPQQLTSNSATKLQFR